MLGEQIGEITGIVTGQRVLDVEEDCPKIEVSISCSGKFKGINVTEMWTYFSLHRNNGSIYGEGKGVITATNGNEYATATGCSVGRHTKSGKMRYAGTHFYRTSSSEGKLSFLNNLVAVIEYEVHHKSSVIHTDCGSANSCHLKYIFVIPVSFVNFSDIMRVLQNAMCENA